MKNSTKHAIENLANELGLEGKHITLVLRKEEDMIENRPNAFYLTRGNKGWTSCKQDVYYINLCYLCGYDGVYVFKNDRKGEVLNGNREDGGSYHKIDYRDYTDDEIMQILESIKTNGVESLSKYGGWYRAK